MMELRHLRYFVAVAEEGSVSLAAEKRLHTAQPSLSRQLRDLEQEVGTPLLLRTARGVSLTAAGQAFLEHAKLALGQAMAAVAAAREAAKPVRASFSVGFLTGQEVDWLPHATRILRGELPNIEFRAVSRYSPELALDLQQGNLDAAFLRVEPVPDVRYRTIFREPILCVLPSDHPLAAKAEIDPSDLASETFIGFSDVPHVLRDTVDGYLRGNGLEIEASYLIDNFAMGLSLVASTRGLALLPAYVQQLLPWSVVSRPLVGGGPTIDLAIGYHKDNQSPVLKTFLSRLDELVEASAAARSLGQF